MSTVHKPQLEVFDSPRFTLKQPLRAHEIDEERVGGNVVGKPWFRSA